MGLFDLLDAVASLAIDSAKKNSGIDLNDEYESLKQGLSGIGQGFSDIAEGISIFADSMLSDENLSEEEIRERAQAVSQNVVNGFANIGGGIESAAGSVVGSLNYAKDYAEANGYTPSENITIEDEYSLDYDEDFWREFNWSNLEDE